MTPAGFLEMIFSVSIQAAILIGVVKCLTMADKGGIGEHRFWSLCHILILLQFLAASCLPHLRLFTTDLTQFPYYVEVVRQLESVIGQFFFIVWGLGTLVSLTRLVVSSCRTLRILKQATEPPPEIQGELTYEKVRGKVISLLISKAVQTPFCWQIHEPVIVLPEKILTLSNKELKLIIQHEVEHLQAGHPLQLFLQRLVEALFWFHPLVWWCSRHAVRSREFYCDSRSVHNREDVLVYLRSLLHLVEKQKAGRKTLSAGFAFSNSSSLIQQRVDRLTTHNWDQAEVTSRRWSWSKYVILGSGLLCILIWMPIDVSASNRSFWSPWPQWSTKILQSVGVPVRDYEIDGHRIRPHEHP